MSGEKRTIFVMLWLPALIFFLLTLACKREPARRQPEQKVVVLGFDGVDPDLVKRYMLEGALPNIAKLSREGTLQELGTTNPPESPVSWASFATGTNPGKHGIFDFLKRDPNTYFPDIALITRERPRFLWGLIPIKRPVIINNRKGNTFYKLAARNGIKATLIRMPLDFPPEEMPNSKLLSGLGIPDIRGTWGTFFYFATDLSRWEVGNTEFGGKLVKLQLNGDEARTEIEGPVDPTEEGFNRISIPLRFRLDRNEVAVTISLDGQEEQVKEGAWSKWFRISFKVTPFLKLHGISRFYVLEVYPELRVYLMPINFHPEDPPVAVSYPEDYSRELWKAVGAYKTLGWLHDTWALNEERISEDVFLEDLFEDMEKQTEITLRELKTDPADLIISIYTATDSVSHMFYRLIDPEHPRYEAELAARYGDSIMKVYSKMDEIIGRVLSTIDERTVLFVVSDHGFHTWRKEFNTNTWLARNGFMALKGMESDSQLKVLDDLFSQGSFFPNVDWSKTKAYSLGLGQIYINLRGREKYGTVAPGEEYEKLRDEIAEKLLSFRDPDTGETVVQGVYKREAIFKGPYVDRAGDLQLSFKTGYRTSWQTALGAIPESIIVANLKKWSGDHCASDISDTGGVLVANRRLKQSGYSIMDIAPTVLRLLGCPDHPEFDGRAMQLQEPE